MDEDPKLNFYLRRREQIEEWANLRIHAARALDRTLNEAARVFLLEPDHTHGSIRPDWTGTHVFLPASDIADRLGVGLWWRPGNMFKPSGYGHWPVLAVTAIDGKKNEYRAAVEAATGTARLKYEMTPGDNEWIWMRHLRMSAVAVDLEKFAAECFETFRAAWSDLGPTIRDAVALGATARATGSGTNQEQA